MFALLGFAAEFELRRRIVTGSLKLTSEAFFMNHFLFTTRGLCLTAFLSWRLICAFLLALTLASAGPGLRAIARAAVTTKERKGESLRLRGKSPPPPFVIYNTPPTCN